MKKVIFILLMLSMGVLATVYEDAEDNRTVGWEIYKTIDGAIIKNLYNKDKKSRVIVLKSREQQSGYMLKIERDSTVWQKTEGKILKWSMQSHEHFVLFVSLHTQKGHRYLIYTSGDKNGWGYYALGSDSINGKWKQFSRDLDADFRRFEPSNKIIAVDTLFIRGNLKIDDIEIEDSPKKLATKPIKKEIVEIDRVPIIDSSKIDDITPPTIKLKGYSILSIPLGTTYIEQGATAIDNIDGTIEVKISEEVNYNRVGTYTLFYMAKDRAGNSSITTRIVNVGLSSNINMSSHIDRKKSTYNKEAVTIESLDFDGLNEDFLIGEGL